MQNSSILQKMEEKKKATNWVKINCYVDKAVWENFKLLVLKKHGKIWGRLGLEVSKALRFYLSNNSSTHTHNLHNGLNPSIQRLEKIKQLLKQKGYQQIDFYLVKQAITRVAGGDQRTINRNLQLLLQEEFLQPLNPKVFQVKNN